MRLTHDNSPRPGHTLMELVVAMVASAVLLAGLGSVMLIGSQVAYTPSAAVRRTAAADVAGQIAEELRYATLVIQQTPQILEFVVADRDGDGTAEKFRYEWSGTPGDPLRKTVGGGTSVTVLEPVDAFELTFLTTTSSTTLETTVDSAETLLLANAAGQNALPVDVTTTTYQAQQINPAYFPSVPANAASWNATRIDFYGNQHGVATETLQLQLRASGEPNDGPTGDVLGQVSVAESSLSPGGAWNTVVFPNPVRGLALHRRYAVVWTGVGGPAARIATNELLPSGMLESTDAGASWQFMTTRQMFYRVYGTYTTPGPSYNHTRNFVSHVRLALQSGDKTHARIDASIPLANSPELLSAYWRTDFDDDPTATNANGDSVADWALAGGASFDDSELIGGVWHADGALETRPLADFNLPTIVEARCRNTTVGGNGAVVRINADRQGGLYAPLLVYVRRQADGSQTLSLVGKTSDAASKTLCSRSRLAGDFIRFRLTILPENDVVNLQVNGEDQGSFTYPTYAPTSSSDRFVTLYADTSLAEFDYVDVRVAAD